MRINEIIIEGILSDIGSGLRNLAYKTTGGQFGGEAAKQDIIRKQYINKLAAEIKQANDSTMRATNQQMNLQNYLDKYFSRYRWRLDSEQINDVKRLINDVYMGKFNKASMDKLGDYMYYLAVENMPGKDRHGQESGVQVTPQLTARTIPAGTAPAKASTKTKPTVTTGGPTPAEQAALQQRLAQASGGAPASVGKARGPGGRFVKKSPTV